MSTVVLSEKLRKPEPSGLGRFRLESSLLGASSTPLTLIVAPPGSGKTTLLARFAARCVAPVAWYRLTSADASEAAFVAHLSRALGEVIGEEVQGDSMLACLHSLEGYSGKSAVVVFDDLQEVSGTSAERALEQFITFRPTSIRVLIGTRCQPEINIPRLRLSGQLTEIQADDLRFRFWEVEELFTAVFHEPLSPESAAALTRRTGGWAAGLQLFHLATSGRSPVERARAIEELGGHFKLVRSYLARNVLADLPEDHRLFMIRTCSLGALSGKLCDALLDSTGSGRILDELERQQLFTSSEDDGQTFHYHEVLRVHLEWALVEEYGAAEARRWHCRTARLLESLGNDSAAVRAYARAEEWGAVARIIQTNRSDLAGAAADVDVLLPAAVVRDDPWLSLTEARRRMREGATEAAARAYQRASELLHEPSFQQICRRERSVALAWGQHRQADAVRAPDLDGTPSEWWSVLRSALRRGVDGRTTSTTETGAAQIGRGLVALAMGDLDSARGLLSTTPSVDVVPALFARLAMTVIDVLTRRCADPGGEFGRIALDADVAGLPWVERLSRGLQEAVLVASGASSWRIDACADIRDECARHGDAWGGAVLRLAAAIAVQVAAPSTETREFEVAAAEFQSLDADVLSVWAEALGRCTVTSRAGSDAVQDAMRIAGRARTARLYRAEAVVRAAADAHRSRTGWSVPRQSGVRDDEGLRSVLAVLLPPPVQRSSRPGSVATPAIAGGTTKRPAVAEPAPAAAQTRAPGTVTLRCLGGFDLSIDDRTVDLAALRPRARALLRLLSINVGRDVHQEQLVDALWPHVDLLIGIRRLQVSVSSVRRLLDLHGLPGSQVLCRSANAYRLALPAGSSADVVDFARLCKVAKTAVARADRLAAVAARESALALYRGELLPEDGPTEYVVADRNRLHFEASTAAAALALDLRELGRFDDAVNAARLSLRLERFQDAMWELLADLHERSGNPSAAEQTRREHDAVMAELNLSEC